MTPSRVGADKHDQIRPIEVLVTARHGVEAEGAALAGDRRGHAQPRISVDVGRTDKSLHQLVGDIIILGQQLPGKIDGDGVWAVARDDLREFSRHRVQRLVPTRAAKPALGVAHHRMQQPPLKRQRFVERRTFGAEPSEIRGMVGIASDFSAAGAVGRREHAAADAAIRASGLRRRGALRGSMIPRASCDHRSRRLVEHGVPQ